MKKKTRKLLETLEYTEAKAGNVLRLMEKGTCVNIHPCTACGFDLKSNCILSETWNIPAYSRSINRYHLRKRCRQYLEIWEEKKNQIREHFKKKADKAKVVLKKLEKEEIPE